MLYHITTYVLGLFGLYGLFIIWMLWSAVHVYQHKISRKIHVVLEEEAKFLLHSILNSTKIHAQTYFQLQHDMIQHSSHLYRQLLSQGDVNYHPINYERSGTIESFNEIQLRYHWYKQFGWDLADSTVLLGFNHFETADSPSLFNDSRKIMSLYNSWSFSMEWRIGNNSAKLVEQQYLQMDNNETKAFYAFPAIISQGANIIERSRADSDISDLCTRVKETNKTMIDYSSFDISEGKKRVISVGFPLMVDGENRGTFIMEGN